MYSKEQIKDALDQYYGSKSVTKTVRILGYPTRRTLYNWINNKDTPKDKRKKTVFINTEQNPRNPSVEIKINAIHRCFEMSVLSF